jgi:very-short-patch-repair endonuclease
MAIDEKVAMFYGADAETFRKAEVLRRNMTKEENLLWERLKDRTQFNAKFRRQHPINIYIADFYCHPLKLVVEVDGGYHIPEEQQKFDRERERDFRLLGIQVIRFTNSDIVNRMDYVIRIIHETIDERQTNNNEIKL